MDQAREQTEVVAARPQGPHLQAAPEAARAAVIRHGYRIALCLRHQDLQIGRHYRRVAVDRDMRQAGEMGKPALDGSLVLPRSRNGNQPRWITSEISRAEVHRMRHASDAIMTGIGTILADDPLLTDRSGLPRRRPVLRVILDSRLRLSPKSQVVRSAQGDVLVFTCASTSSARAKKLSAHGAKVFHVRARRSRPDLQAVLEELGRRDILSVMLEAGPLLNQAALEADVVEKVRLFYAPTLVGLGSSLPGLASCKRARAFRVREISGIRTETFGPDFAVEGYLRDVYRDR